MKSDSKEFRMREADKVRLGQRPTKVKPFYKSKKQYAQMLAEHVGKLSDRQSLL